jgi:hypothetical protein
MLSEWCYCYVCQTTPHVTSSCFSTEDRREATAPDILTVLQQYLEAEEENSGTNILLMLRVLSKNSFQEFLISSAQLFFIRLLKHVYHLRILKINRQMLFRQIDDVHSEKEYKTL